MTSTPVKDVGSILSSLSNAVGNSAKTAADNGFQTMLNGHTGRNGTESRADSYQSENARTTVKKTPGESLKAKDAHQARVEDQKEVNVDGTEQETGEIPAEKLEEVMEVLGTAAMDLMQQIADTFGISMEELESTMQELGMEIPDVLDQGKLGELILQLGGAQDAYALVTDGELYEDYQELMGSLEEMLQTATEELNISPEQLKEAIQPEVVEEDASREIPVEVVRETGDEVQAKPETEKPVETEEVQEPEQAQPIVTETEDRRSTEENSSQSETEADERRSEHDRSDHAHLAAQNFRTEQFQSQFGTQVQQTAAAPDVWGTDTQDIMRQIMDYMRIQIKPDTSSLEMQLHPESLGSLHIQIASKGGMVTANFIAQNETVRAALESQMVQLRESFEEQGVKVEAIEVTVQSHAFERNLDQGRGQSSAQEQNQAARRTRTRKINLNDPLETENLEEEDALAAEMMAASGSQVDYTV